MNIFIFLFVTVIYSQEGAYVDKDYRIKKYQKEMIKILIDNQWLEKKEKGEIIIKNYTGNMGVTKCIEVFPINLKKNKVLLVRFYAFGSGAESYWGILEKDSKLLFYYDEKYLSKMNDYMKKYDVNTQKIILDYVKNYIEWAGPNLHNPQIIDADKK